LFSSETKSILLIAVLNNYQKHTKHTKQHEHIFDSHLCLAGSLKGLAVGTAKGKTLGAILGTTEGVSVERITAAGLCSLAPQKKQH
jgi:hypothetical protein